MTTRFQSRGKARARTNPKARWRHDSAEVSATRADVRIVVIADTHSQPHANSEAAVRAVEPDAILHAGDIGDATVLQRFEAIAPLVVVRGNIDGREHFPDSVDIEVKDAEQKVLSTLLLQHICVYGPKLRKDAVQNAQKHGAQIVVCGHSHVPFIGRDKGLWMFNPGSIGPRRFSLPIVFGVMAFGPSGVQMRHINCETGQPWTP